MSEVCPKISIIVPVYNVEETIKKSLDSIVKQTFQDWELILVDDGSTDSSGKICDTYSKSDNRIKVIHKINKGVSAARQTGLINASGEYIIHADPDDWVELNMLKEMYAEAEESDADMLICDYFTESNGNVSYRLQRPSSLNPNIVLNELLHHLHGSCWNKLIKRSCIIKHDARFPDGINYCEDVCFLVQLLKHDIKVAYLNKAYYHYVQNHDSLTNNFNQKTFNDGKLFVEFLLSQLNENSLTVRLAKELIKTNAFRFSLVTREEIANLYPEIKKVTNQKKIPSLMYNFAFNGQYFYAKCLLYIYNFIQNTRIR